MFKSNPPGNPAMDYRLAVALGLVAGAKAISILGNATGVAITSTPMLLWDAQILYPWQNSAQSLEVLSSDAGDAAAGIGGRQLVIESLDGNYNEQVTTVTMNGTTPIALPGVHKFINRMYFISTGSNHTNVGNVTLRLAGAGATVGYVKAAQSVMHSYQYTVPAGKMLAIDNFYIDVVGANKTANIILDFCVRLQDGTIQLRQENFAYSANTPNNVIFPTPATIGEKQTAFIQVASVDQNGSSISVSSTGILVAN